MKKQTKDSSLLVPYYKIVVLASLFVFSSSLFRPFPPNLHRSSSPHSLCNIFNRENKAFYFCKLQTWAFSFPAAIFIFASVNRLYCMLQRKIKVTRINNAGYLLFCPSNKQALRSKIIILFLIIVTEP